MRAYTRTNLREVSGERRQRRISHPRLSLIWSSDIRLCIVEGTVEEWPTRHPEFLRRTAQAQRRLH
jgi:hypothetical protein